MINKRSLAEEIIEGFAELKAMRNIEPYIWMDNLGTWFTDEDYQNLDDLDKKDMFPLYTHLAKTLTHGINLLEKYADKLEDERPNKGLSDVVYECVAILRKAQE